MNDYSVIVCDLFTYEVEAAENKTLLESTKKTKAN